MADDATGKVGATTEADDVVRQPRSESVELAVGAHPDSHSRGDTETEP
jgi:hypothetical protein